MEPNTHRPRQHLPLHVEGNLNGSFSILPNDASRALWSNLRGKKIGCLRLLLRARHMDRRGPVSENSPVHRREQDRPTNHPCATPAWAGGWTPPHKPPAEAGGAGCGLAVVFGSSFGAAWPRVGRSHPQTPKRFEPWKIGSDVRHKWRCIPTLRLSRHALWFSGNLPGSIDIRPGASKPLLRRRCCKPAMPL